MAKPTINDVARVAGVSKKTVSRVINQSPLLNEGTRAKVEQVIAELGYVPDPQARALALRRSSPAAGAPAAGEAAPCPAPAAPLSPPPAPVAPPAPAPVQATSRHITLVHGAGADAQLPAIQQGIADILQGTGVALTLLPLTGAAAEAELRAFIDAQRPFGIILLPPLSESDGLAGLCRALGCPHVRLGASALDEPAHLVMSEDREASVRAVDYLISLGHQRIGFVTGPDESRVAQERELGYLDAMADHELDRGPSLIANGDFTFESGLAAGLLLLEVSPRPTAILASNDEMAAGLIHAAAQKGIKVPEALSIIGFDDTAIAPQLWPPLTTVRVPFGEMAQAAALKLIDRAQPRHAPASFRPQLIARASAGPAPRQG